MTKILYSPGHGAGWSSWADHDPELRRWMVTYQPLIEAIEAGLPTKDGSPVVDRFLADLAIKFGPDVCVCTYGAARLKIKEVSGPFRIEEHDGAETVIEASAQEWIVP